MSDFVEQVAKEWLLKWDKEEVKTSQAAAEGAVRAALKQAVSSVEEICVKNDHQVCDCGAIIDAITALGVK